MQYRALVMAWFRLFYPHMGIVTSLLKWSHLMSCESNVPARTVDTTPLFTQSIPFLAIVFTFYFPRMVYHIHNRGQDPP
jgi:hypothetical protein